MNIEKMLNADLVAAKARRMEAKARAEMAADELRDYINDELAMKQRVSVRSNAQMVQDLCAARVDHAQADADVADCERKLRVWTATVIR